jgi:hypothetical protein
LRRRILDVPKRNEAVFLAETGLSDPVPDGPLRRPEGRDQSKLENLEVTPMNENQNNGPLIGAGTESLLALSFAGGMFALALLRPVLGLWLPF